MQKRIVQRVIPEHNPFDDSVHPVLQRVYRARNITSPDELDYSLNRLLPFQQLKGMETAVDLLTEFLTQRKRILIVADFDADGATSCALAIRCLKSMGASNVDYIVPNRFEFGYGLTPEIVAVAATSSPDLIVTVDNGISSIEGVRAAKQRGIKVLITDHHLPGQQLPDADAIVNPNQPHDDYASKCLAGVGVMFNILIALRAHLRQQDWFVKNNIEEPNLADLLDLVALGTVADVVPLDRNNRILVAQGLARIRRGQCSAGIKALLKIAKRDLQRVCATDLAFAIAPRLNAAGRLTDMSLGIECLLTDDDGLATDMARQLDELNRERRQIQNSMQEQAMAALTTTGLADLTRIPHGLCLYDSDWHQGVVGILASKVKERFHRPTIVFAPDNHDLIKGSARSIDGLHIRDVLETLATEQPGLIDKFGGHAMAAGLTIKHADFARFNQLFDEVVARTIDKDNLNGTIHSDGELNDDDFSLSLATLIRNAGPWGQGFPEPLFNGRFKLMERKIVGESHLKMQLTVNGSNKHLEAIAFNTVDEEWPQDVEMVDLVYRLDINHYLGQTRLQLLVDEVFPVVAD